MNWVKLIIVLIVVFAESQAHPSRDAGDDQHLLDIVVDLQSTIIHLEERVAQLEKTDCKQSTDLEHLEEKVEHLESKQQEIEEHVDDVQEDEMKFNQSIIQLQLNDEEIREEISNIQCSCSSIPTPEATTTKAAATTTPEPTTTAPPTNIRECREWFNLGYSENGVYEVNLSNKTVRVFCDMDNGGWTVLQKRTDHTINYDRDFEDYQRGFGDVSGEHWIGLDIMHQLTSTGDWTLRLDFESFEDEHAWAEYDGFSISEGTDYKIFFVKPSYRGDLGDEYGLSYQYGCKFTSRDFDQDERRDINCATDDGYEGGGFWYYGCAYVSTTGMRYGDRYSIQWYDWKEIDPIKSVIMKIITN